jgi:MtrB/PioB family decaheme-associated outer membrane protein
MVKKVLAIGFGALMTGLFFSPSVWAAGSTTVRNIRVGLHENFTRVVFDSEGARPLRVGPPSSGQISISYGEFRLLADPNRIFREGRGAVAKAIYKKTENAATITITFKYPNTQVNSFFLSADPPQEGGYRLVMDFYPPEIPIPKESKDTSGKTVTERKSETGREVPKSLSAPVSGAETKAPPRPGTASSVQPVAPKGITKERADEEKTAQKEGPVTQAVLSGEAGVIGRDTDVKGDAAKFEQYRDLSQPVSGDLNVRYDEEDTGFLQFDASKIAQDDQYLHAAGSRYGKARIDVSYDKIPHRFATGAQTLYSGIGSDTLTLDDKLQGTLEATPFPEVANQLNAFLSAGAVSGDPQFLRKQGKVDLDLVALDPFNFRVELKRLKRNGTRPYAGSFGLNNNEGMEELLRPVDDETRELRFVAEYAEKPLLLNLTYYLSLYTNNADTLTWDNPLRLTDAVGGPSRGLIDLPPDNEYHNISLSGSLLDLPLDTTISAVVAWGLMKQDDPLVPYTINTAIAQPPLPAGNVDAEVNTSLLDFAITSRLLEFMRAKGKFRYFEYDNDTAQIEFPNGYVVSDTFLDPDPVKNLPISYKKTTAGADLGFDLSRHNRLTLGYTFYETRRENREVAKQKDNIFRGAIDSSLLSWLDLRLSYERTDRDIDGYNYTVPLAGGGADTQEPLLRKYTEADMVRDRLQFLSTVYPMEALALSGSFIYGEDDFEDSPFGLQEDTHYAASLDFDYRITERGNLHAFYSYEKYQALQRNNGLVGSNVSEWFAESEDKIHTVGAGIDVSLIPKRLDLSVSYSLSDVDGDIHFFTPAQDTSDFPIVDETRLQILNANLKCHLGKGLYVTLGYLYEKFDFDDFQNQGFTNVPTTSTGVYNGGLLLGTLTESYKANVGYVKISYRF